MKKRKELENKIGKNWLDMSFSIIALLVLIALYWLLDGIINEIRASNGCSTSGDNSFFACMVLLLGPTLVLSLLLNIPIQIFLNNTSVKNKTKSYIFFVALNIDMIFFSLMFLVSGITFSSFFIIISLISIRYLIARYYYKKLQKITLNLKKSNNNE
jgi:hypothetical protein